MNSYSKLHNKSKTNFHTNIISSIINQRIKVRTLFLAIIFPKKFLDFYFLVYSEEILA